MIDITATNADIGIALHLSGIGMTEETLTATIDITHRSATEQHVAGISISSRLHLVTAYLTIADIDTSVTFNDSHLATTKDAGANLCARTAHADISTVFHSTTVVVRRIVILLTHTTAIDATEGVLNNTPCISILNGLLCRISRCNLRTDSTTREENLRTVVLSCCGVISLYGTILATAIDITHNPRITADGQFRTLDVTQLLPFDGRS